MKTTRTSRTRRTIAALTIGALAAVAPLTLSSPASARSCKWVLVSSSNGVNVWKCSTARP